MTSIEVAAFSGDTLLTTVNVPAGISYAPTHSAYGVSFASVFLSFDCTAVTPTPSPTYLGTICTAPTTEVITSATPNSC